MNPAYSVGVKTPTHLAEVDACGAGNLENEFRRKYEQ